MQSQQQQKLVGRLAAVCLAGSLGVSGAAFAVTQDGVIGATSTGTLDVSVAVPPLALIENLDAISLNYTSGDTVGSDTFCIWSTTGGYNITISSFNGVGTFVADSGTDTVNYNVVFDDTTDPSTGSAVTEGSNVTGYSTPDSVFPAGCSGGDNAVLEVTFPAAGNLDGASAGNYTDEVTLLVAPE